MITQVIAKVIVNGATKPILVSNQMFCQQGSLLQR